MCIEWAILNCSIEKAESLSAARRPKPPSLKQQALDQLDEVVGYAANVAEDAVIVDTIRRAIESLPDD
jgi:hypothetical protein